MYVFFLQRTNLTFYHLVTTLHELVKNWEVVPSPDPEIRRITVQLKSPDEWEPAVLRKKILENPAEVEAMREKYKQQQAQRRFKSEVRGGGTTTWSIVFMWFPTLGYLYVVYQPQIFHRVVRQ